MLSVSIVMPSMPALPSCPERRGLESALITDGGGSATSTSFSPSDSPISPSFSTVVTTIGGGTGEELSAGVGDVADNGVGEGGAEEGERGAAAVGAYKRTATTTFFADKSSICSSSLLETRPSLRFDPCGPGVIGVGSGLSKSRSPTARTGGRGRAMKSVSWAI
jgi:hypothetical protein